MTILNSSIRNLKLAVLTVVGLLVGACAPPQIGGTGADFGATQGGVQDMGLARTLIENGQVPPPEAFVVEGMFSEHDLGLDGEPCSRELCLRTDLGIAPTLDDVQSGWLQVGLSSTIDPDTFERPSLTLIATMDVSGSMGWDYTTERTEFPTPGQVTRNLLSAIAADLGPNDRIALVTYGTTVEDVIPLTSGDQQVTIQAAIDSLGTGGVTDMESGLRRAFEIAETTAVETEQVRVILFSDLQPNVGADTPSEFEEIAADGANRGVGLTVMGVGVGLGQEFLNAITHLRGGNAFSLFNDDDVTELMSDDWPFLVSPIAYDLNVDVTPSAGFTITETYGFPSSDDDNIAKLDLSTVFLSRRRGALLLQLLPDEGTDMGGLSVSGTLSYRTPDGEEVSEQVDATYLGQTLDEQGRHFDQTNTAKTVALALLVSNMKQAATFYERDRELAIQIMTGTLARFSADIGSLDDPAMTDEVNLALELLQLMESGADQGDLYGAGFIR